MKLFFSSLFLPLSLATVSLLDVFPEKTWAIDKPVAVSAPAQGNISPEEKLLHEGKYQEVVDQLLPKIADLDNKNLKLLGRAYSGLKNSAAATKTFNLVLAKNPKDAEAGTLIGLEQLSQGKDREAMISFREALKNDSKYEPGYLAIEKIYVKKNNKYELRMLYSDMVDVLGEKPQYVSRLCELYTNSGLYDDSKKTCSHGIEIQKDEPKNYIFLANTLKETGEREEAIKLYKKIGEMFKTSEEAQLSVAQYMDNEKNYIDSNKYFKAATEINPKSLKALLGFAMSSLELEKFQETFDALDKACKMDGRSVREVKRSLGFLHTMKEEKWLEKFTELSEKCGLPGYGSKSAN